MLFMNSFLTGITPFIGNMSKNQVGKEPAVQKIYQNGVYICPANTVKVKVPQEGLTPEEEQKIVDETIY